MNRTSKATVLRRLTTAAIAAILLAPLASPRASAAPSIAELTSSSESAASALAASSSKLAAVDARLNAARQELAAVEARLPSSPRQQARAVATAVGAVFSPALLDRAERIAADERARAQLRTEIRLLAGERGDLAAQVAAAQQHADASAAAVVEAQRVEADRVRAERIATFGLFPVAGSNSYIDSWGFPRSGGRAHQGADIMAERGTPIVAVRNGWAVPGSNGYGGLTVWLHADDGTRYYFAHLDTIAVGEGRVVAGQVIGTVGDTGNARGTPPHLHFEIHQPSAVNPFPILEQMAR